MVNRPRRRPSATGLGLIVGGLVVAAALTGTAAQADCSALMPQPVAPGPLRDLTARDLIRMRNVGEPDGANAFAESPLALAADGRRLAFLIDRSDPDDDSYCQALVVLDLDHPGTPLVVDRGGERIAEQFSLRGAHISDGWPQAITPAWSPDGRAIGYLKRVAGITQLWIAAADGSSAHDVSHSSVDVEHWGWSPDGSTLVFTARPGRLAATRAIDEEGKTGWLYDDRMWPGMSPKPLPVDDARTETFVTDTAGAVRRADAADARSLAAMLPIGTAAVADVTDARGWRATARNQAPSPLSPRRIVVVEPGGHQIACSAAACEDGAVKLWWDGADLLYLRREDFDHEDMALYRWTPGPGAPRQILHGSDVLIGCVFVKRLVCTSEASASPRRIVSIDPVTGRVVTLFDPYPEFARIRLGSVQRLRLRNRYGLPGWGDLVLPPDYRPGARLPMIVTQYHSRGFLRGGTGDDYPIFLFAARGYAVLSLDRPPSIATTRPALTSYDQINAFDNRDWGDRRNILSSIEGAVDQAVATGAVDPRRVGITGLSDGSASVQFALVNTRRFAAAEMSTCCLEPHMVMTQGTAWATFNRKVMGFPPLTRPDPAFWAPISLVQNAARIDVPILIQEADREHGQAVDAFTALREQHKPVEMIVYPDEYHTKVDPRHRLAVYERDVDWFDFWLCGHEDPDPAKTTQYARWRALRAEWQHAP